MPRVDWDGVPDANTYEPLPFGWYRVRVEKCTEKKTKAGDPMYSIEYEVVDGKYTGRKLFDNVVFNTAAFSRAKLICKRLGLTVNGLVDVEPTDFLGKEVMVKTDAIDEYLTGKGEKRTRNIIPFAGYRSLEEGVEETPAADDDLPF